MACLMTEQALEHDRTSGYFLAPLKEVYVDPDFNCRGNITAGDVIELAEDIAKKGLLVPVILRPLWDTETDLLKRGYRYFLIAGFRRLTSYKVNDADYVPSRVKNVMSDFECRDINAIENLQRKELTFYQEARSIRHYWLADWTRQDISERISKSSGWVQQRIQLLEMEPEIQQAAEQGYIGPGDMNELTKFRGDERLQIAAKFRDARKAGVRISTLKIKKKDKPNTKKIRKGWEVDDLMVETRKELLNVDMDKTLTVRDLISPQGNCITHRILAWSLGNVSSLDMYFDLKEFFKKLGHDTYVIPDFEEEKAF